MSNVILITIDCLRADHLSCLGYDKQITPNLDNLAQKGALFSNAISNGNGTLESFPSIMTSTYALMNPNSGKKNNAYEHWLKIPENRPTIAEILQSNGYSTAGINANPFLTTSFSYHRGFDFFDDSLASYFKQARENLFKKLYRKINTIRGIKYKRANKINDEAINWLKNNLEKFFLWLHYMDAHSDYNPRNISYINRLYALRLQKKIFHTRAIDKSAFISDDDIIKLIKLYDKEICYIDNNIGFLLQKLNKMGISIKNTYIIITADHGEQFMEHGGLQHGDLYDEGLHVPLIICGPNIKENTIIKEQVSLLDLCPTITDILNINKSNTFMGNSLSPLLFNKKTISSEHVISETISRNYSIRTNNWKYITDRMNRKELYNLDNDPKEKINLIEHNKNLIKEYDDLLYKHINMEKKAVENISYDLSEQDIDIIKDRLKKLGYI